MRTPVIAETAICALNAGGLRRRWGVETSKNCRDSDIQFIRGWTHDGDAVKWPKSSRDHA